MEEKIVTIQKTSKKWKKVYLISFFTLSIGFITLLMGVSTENDSTGVFGILLMLSSVVGFVVAKIGAWWTNR